MFGLGLKPIEVIGGILFILAILGCFFGMGWVSGSNHVQKKFDAYKSSQAVAVEADRSGRQDKADSIDEQASQQIQDLMIKNAKLQEELDAETVKPNYDCVIPDAGIKLHNDAIRTN